MVVKLAVELSEQQQDALDAIHSWYSNPYRPQVFRMFGYAGTGKTTMAKTIRAQFSGALFAAYTGKAAQVLTRKGVPATTLHKLIYRPNGETIECQRDEFGKIILDVEGHPIPVEGAEPKPSFIIDAESPLWYANLLVVDEVSMVNKRLGEDILSFEKPVLVLGDPAQLPPVEGGGYFTKDEPNILLTEVHRHAKDSKVLDTATKIRRGIPIKKAVKVSIGQAAEYDQVIVGTNKVRLRLNAVMREHMGYPVGIPVAGDKIIILQNNYELGVMNGQTFRVIEYNHRTGIMIGEDDDGDRRELEVWQKGFTPEGEAELKKMPYYDQTTRIRATFAWAITCHKSQGSQWPNVLVIDESNVFASVKHRWLYTAVTRAAESVKVVNPTGLVKGA